MEIDILQYRFIRLVAEIYMFEPDIALDVVRDGVLVILNFGPLVDDGEDAFDGYCRIGHPSGHKHQPSNGTENHGGIGAELNQLADAHLVVQNQVAADKQHQVLAKLNQIVRNGSQKIEQPLAADCRRCKFGIIGAKTPDFPLFLAEGLHHPNPA
ncbi:hypothetical protein D3C75_961760 [compost metagenome]